jgi:hypothetical protein
MLPLFPCSKGRDLNPRLVSSLIGFLVKMRAPVFAQAKVVENEILFHELYGPCGVNALRTYFGTFSGIVAVENAVACGNKVTTCIAGIIPGIDIVSVCLG